MEFDRNDSGFLSLTSCTHFIGKYPDFPRSWPSNLPFVAEPMTNQIEKERVDLQGAKKELILYLYR